MILADRCPANKLLYNYNLKSIIIIIQPLQMSQMNEDNEYSLRLCDYRKRSTYSPSYTSLINQLIESPYPYNWKIIDQLISPLLDQKQKNMQHLLQISRLISSSIKKIKTLTLLFYIYELKKKYDDVFSFYGINWKFQYEDIGVQLGDLSILSSWVIMHWKCQITQDTLWLIVRNMIQFIKVENISFRQFQLTCIIEWIAFFHTIEPNTDRFIDSCQLIKLAKQTRILSAELSLQNKKQHLLYRSILQICSYCENPSPNIFLFIYPMPFMQNQIMYFCQIYSDFITNLSEQGLVNIFNAFTKGTLCKQSLLFILKISNILANEEEFFKLRYLYQSYILPVLIKNGKSCNRVYQNVLEIASLYVLGFIKHCDIGEDGMKCLTNNIGKIKNQVVQNKWLQLCSSICNMYPDLKTCAVKMLKKQFNRDIQLAFESEGSVVSDHPDSVWEITVRNGRKHKKYNKVASKMLGIYNRNNQCYIISIVQGLLKVGYFQALLDKFKQQIKGGSVKLLDEFRILFGEVSGARKTKDKINVGYLKRLSPQPFNKSQHQQDAYQFLIKILQIVQLELQKVPGMLQQFKQIFEIDEMNTILCSKCKFSTQNSDKKYIMTIPSKNILAEVNQGPLNDFKCPKCEQKGYCSMQTKLLPKSKILMVHINRFTQDMDGNIIKQLSTQRILRKFINYELVGMVVHKGKKIDRGHYVYYHRINPKRWALFNDSNVEEFQLQLPFEEFQRQWKAQMAPYILFYKNANDTGA